MFLIILVDSLLSTEDLVTSLCDRFTEDASLVAQGGKPIGCFKDSFKDRFLGTNS